MTTPIKNSIDTLNVPPSVQSLAAGDGKRGVDHRSDASRIGFLVNPAIEHARQADVSRGTYFGRLLSFIILLLCGWQQGLRVWFSAGVSVAAGMAWYHYTLISTRERDACFYAFRHKQWLEGAVVAGVVLDYAFG